MWNSFGVSFAYLLQFYKFQNFGNDIGGTLSDQQDWTYNLDRIQKTLTRRISITLRNNLAQIKHLGKRLQHPRQRLRELNQRIDNLELRLLSKSRFDATARQIESIQDELIDKVNMKMSEQNNCLINLIQRLHTLSPLATLKRGYSITTHGGKNGTIVRNAANLKKNDVIDIYTKTTTGYILDANRNGRYAMPLSWHSNLDNTDITTVAQPQYFEHFYKTNFRPNNLPT